MMNRFLKWFGWRPAPGTIAGGIVFLAGILLTGIDWRFLVLCGTGAFGPGILREFGILRDQDEFQRRASRRAGYHAFLVTGFAAFAIIGHYRSGGIPLGETGVVVSVLLSLLWFTWLLSSLLSYWGPYRTAKRVLYTFGIFWLIFAILSNTGHGYSGFLSILIHSLVSLPFFTLALFSDRWPKIVGGLLLISSGFFFYFFGLYRMFGPHPLGRGRGEVTIFLIGPLLASGLALLFAQKKDDS